MIVNDDYVDEDDDGDGDEDVEYDDEMFLFYFSFFFNVFIVKIYKNYVWNQIKIEKKL